MTSLDTTSPSGLLSLQPMVGNRAANTAIRNAGGRAPQGAVPVQRMFNAAMKTLGLNRDVRAEGSPRADSVRYIGKALKDAGLENEDTVGHSIMAAISSIQTLAGENGARTISKVFCDPALVELYKTPNNSPQAAHAHEEIAKRELAYWQAEHAKHPTKGSETAVAFDVGKRVQLQQQSGMMAQYSKKFASAFKNEFG